MTHNQKVSLILSLVGCVLLVIAILIGIGDNPPGIVLLFLSVMLFVLAVVHHWRSLKKFLILAAASLIGIPVFSILHNLFEALGELTTDISLLARMSEVLSALSFFTAIMVCPAGLVSGLIGILICFIYKKRTRGNLKSPVND